MSEDCYDSEFLVKKRRCSDLSSMKAKLTKPLKEISEVDQTPSSGQGNQKVTLPIAKISHGKPRSENKRGERYKKLSKKSRMELVRASRKKDTPKIPSRVLPRSTKDWQEGYVPPCDEQGRRITCNGCKAEVVRFEYHIRWCRYPRKRAEKLKNCRHFS